MNNEELGIWLNDPMNWGRIATSNGGRKWIPAGPPGRPDIPNILNNHRPELFRFYRPYALRTLIGTAENIKAETGSESALEYTTRLVGAIATEFTDEEVLDAPIPTVAAIGYYNDFFVTIGLPPYSMLNAELVGVGLPYEYRLDTLEPTAVLNHGIRIPANFGARLYPELVAAGYVHDEYSGAYAIPAKVVTDRVSRARC